MDKIRRQQALAAPPLHHMPPKHQPEMLYIGCVDARLDPIDDIGIEKGNALIFRNIGAIVPKDERHDAALNRAMPAGLRIPQHASIGAVLEFFLNHLPLEEDKVKHIVVSGHTDCGGIRACRHSTCSGQDHYLPLYLENLKDTRAKVMCEAKISGWDDTQILRALEKESVRQSLANLLTYPLVRQAVERGKIEAHGWVIDIASRRIFEMNPKTLEFEPIARPL